MKTVVVVAHPDDEILWAGGYLAAHPFTDVICCTVPQKAPERCLVFMRVCRLLLCNPIVLASCADIVNESIEPLDYVKRFVRSQYDQVITHNVLGEYGHAHHRAVNRAMCGTGLPMKVFGYGITADGDPVDLEKKRRMLAYYTTQPRCFEVWSQKFDLSKEAFLDVNSSA